MARNPIPKYRRQKNKSGDRAFVELGGVRRYLGAYNSAESRATYARTLTEWEANGRQLPSSPEEITTVELCSRFWRHAKTYYVDSDGQPNRTAEHFAFVLRPLKELYGNTLAREFGPRHLKAIRHRFVSEGKCRRYVNQLIVKVRAVFKWATGEGLVPPSVYAALQAVPGLKRGRCNAREPEPVRPAPDDFVDAIRPHVSRKVWALVELQRLTGMRSGEVVTMRGRNLDTTGELWLYRPEAHRTAYREHDRIVEIGPRAQGVIRPFLKRDLEAHLFSPREATAERYAAAPTHRRPNQEPNARKTERVIRGRYTPASYRRAIQQACDAADRSAKKQLGRPADAERIIPRWHPHQLRHAFGTRVRKEYGIEAARVALGHRSVPMAELYSEIDRAKARAIMTKIG